MPENVTLGSLFDPEPEKWGFRGDPHLWRRMREFFRDTALPASAEILEALVSDAFQVLSGHPFDETEDFYVEDFDTGGMSAGRISIRFWHQNALALLRRRFDAASRGSGRPSRDRLM
jgi:molybdenum cofactor cytidylyltransferase